MPEQIQPLAANFPPAPAPPLSVGEAPLSGGSNEDKLVIEKKSKIFRKTAVLLAVLLALGLGFFVFKLISNKKIGKGQTTIIYWGLFEPESVMQQVISEYEKTHPGVKVKYSQQNLTQYREKLQQRLSASSEKTDSKTAVVAEVPDIFRIHQSWIPMLASSLSNVPATIYDVTTFENTFYPSAKESLKFQGQYKGIPLMVDGLALFYNEDLFKAKGIKYPAGVSSGGEREYPIDWKELKIAAQQLTTRDSQGKIVTAGVALGNTSNVDHWSDILGLMLLQSGIDLGSPGACFAGDDGIDICPGADALEFFTNFVTKDRVWDSTQPTSTFAFAKGILGMYFGPSWRVFDMEGIKARLQTNFQYRIVPVPQLPMEDESKVSWSSYWVEAVSNKSKYQQEAWEFLKYLSSKEVMQKLFQTQSAVRPFGEPFSRVDMSELLKNHPFAGAFITQAPYAKNWYLSSFTSDGGLNDKIIKYYENAVNEVNQGGNSASALQTVGNGVQQILTQYGVSK